MENMKYESGSGTNVEIDVTEENDQEESCSDHDP